MRIAIASINYSPEMTGIGVYTTGMAEYLAAEGHQVDVYTGFSYYPAWKKRPEDAWASHRIDTIAGVTVHRNDLYVPSRPSALKRMLHELSFIATTAIDYLFSRAADCTIIVSPPLFAGIPIALLAKLKGSRTVFHVQDLQPDAAVELGMLKPGLVTSVFYTLERMTYQLCDSVSTISEGMCKRIADKGVPREKISLFRNWAHDHLVVPMDSQTGLRKEWGLDGKFVVLYSGNLGVKQGLGSLLGCAQRLQANEDIVFVISGDGGEKAELVRNAEQLGLSNMIFKPLQPQERLSELLATADVSVMPQKKGIKDIVLPSKLGNILCSERPVVVASAQDSELCRIVHYSDCGIAINQEDDAEMAEAINTLYADAELRSRFARNGHEFARNHLGHRMILGGFVRELEAIEAGGRDVALDQAA